MTINDKYATGVKGDLFRGYLRSTVSGVDTSPTTPNLSTDWDARGLLVIGRILTEGWSSDQSSTSTEQKDYGDYTVYVEETDKTDEFTINFLGLYPEAIGTWLGADNLIEIDGGYMLKYGHKQATEVSIAILSATRYGKKFDFYCRRAVPSSTVSRTFGNDGAPLGSSITFKALWNDIDEATHIELLEGEDSSS